MSFHFLLSLQLKLKAMNKIKLHITNKCGNQ